MSNQPIRFQVGETYAVRSLGDWDCIFSFEVLNRYGSLVEITDGHSTYRRRVNIQDGVESIKPYGTYSLAPTLRANRKEV